MSPPRAICASGPKSRAKRLKYEVVHPTGGPQKVTPHNEVPVSSRKIVILIAAIGVGVFAGIALLNYVRGIENDVYADAQPVEVLIATADIPEGTPVADALNSIQVTEVPLKIRPATFVSPSNLDPITGLIARNDIPQNQIIVSGLFVDPAIVTVSLRDQIPAGMVALAMEIDTTRAVGGYLQPGDEVNMMVNHSRQCSTDEEVTADDAIEDALFAESAENAFGGSNISEDEYCTYVQPARYFYQRLEILAIGARQQIQTGESNATALIPQGGTITFMVPNEAAQLLASVAPEDIYLTLLPDGYEAEPLPALNESLMGNRTPAEIGTCASPYGPDGFIEGDSEAVADTIDSNTDFVDGHCTPIWEESGE
ncbi:MAG: Flp pilus assembly protein CpaB [Candidatus Aldehydirespiratoraceae bacterium]|jgi:Flp pilus assembly protein CpaB